MPSKYSYADIKAYLDQQYLWAKKKKKKHLNVKMYANITVCFELKKSQHISAFAYNVTWNNRNIYFCLYNCTLTVSRNKKAAKSTDDVMRESGVIGYNFSSR